MKWLFYLISLVSVGLAVFSFAESVSDIQIIIGIQFVTLAILSFGLARVLTRFDKLDESDP